jgi:hypothetical protein
VKQLYPAQQHAVDYWASLARPRRRVWAWNTGCGKTAATLSAVERLTYSRVLVVCPALVRRHWLREVSQWTLRTDAACIEIGRKRLVSTTARVRRRAAYSANIQIVSYDLVGEVDSAGWDLIVFDEAHHLATPTSVQSRRCEGLCRANPGADILGLTATLIPTEAEQVWNPMRLLFGPAKWGKPATSGRNQINWNFRMRYCNVERNEYGVSTWGCREDRRAELAGRLKSGVTVLRREDIIADLPPLDLSLLDLPPMTVTTAGDPHRFPGTQRTTLLPPHAKVLITWAEQCAEDSSHIVILVHHRDLVEELRTQLMKDSIPLRNHDVRCVTGEIPAAARVEALDACGRLDRVVLVGTHDSIAEGVRLMWAKQVLIDEWSMSPGRVLQTLGRFQSVGSPLRPCVHLRATAETWGDAEKLLERVNVVQDVLGKDKGASGLAKILTQGEPSPDDMMASWLDVLSSQRTGELSEDDEVEVP